MNDIMLNCSLCMCGEGRGKGVSKLGVNVFGTFVYYMSQTHIPYKSEEIELKSHSSILIVIRC